MKNKKLLVGLLSASGIAITLPAIASCSKNNVNEPTVSEETPKEREVGAKATRTYFYITQSNVSNPEETKVKVVNLKVNGASASPVSGLIKSYSDSGGNILVIFNMSIAQTQYSADTIEFDLKLTNKKAGTEYIVTGFSVTVTDKSSAVAYNTDECPGLIWVRNPDTVAESEHLDIQFKLEAGYEWQDPDTVLDVTIDGISIRDDLKALETQSESLGRHYWYFDTNENACYIYVPAEEIGSNSDIQVTLKSTGKTYVVDQTGVGENFTCDPTFTSIQHGTSKKTVEFHPDSYYQTQSWDVKMGDDEATAVSLKDSGAAVLVENNTKLEIDTSKVFGKLWIYASAVEKEWNVTLDKSTAPNLSFKEIKKSKYGQDYTGILVADPIGYKAKDTTATCVDDVSGQESDPFAITFTQVPDSDSEWTFTIPAKYVKGDIKIVGAQEGKTYTVSTKKVTNFKEHSIPTQVIYPTGINATLTTDGYHTFKPVTGSSTWDVEYTNLSGTHSLKGQGASFTDDKTLIVEGDKILGTLAITATAENGKWDVDVPTLTTHMDDKSKWTWSQSEYTKDFTGKIKITDPEYTYKLTAASYFDADKSEAEHQFTSAELAEVTTSLDKDNNELSVTIPSKFVLGKISLTFTETANTYTVSTTVHTHIDYTDCPTTATHDDPDGYKASITVDDPTQYMIDPTKVTVKTTTGSVDVPHTLTQDTSDKSKYNLVIEGSKLTADFTIDAGDAVTAKFAYTSEKDDGITSLSPASADAVPYGTDYTITYALEAGKTIDKTNTECVVTNVKTKAETTLKEGTGLTISDPSSGTGTIKITGTNITGDLKLNVKSTDIIYTPTVSATGMAIEGTTPTAKYHEALTIPLTMTSGYVLKASDFTATAPDTPNITVNMTGKTSALTYGTDFTVDTTVGSESITIPAGKLEGDITISGAVKNYKTTVTQTGFTAASQDIEYTYGEAVNITATMATGYTTPSATITCGSTEFALTTDYTINVTEAPKIVVTLSSTGAAKVTGPLTVSLSAAATTVAFTGTPQATVAVGDTTTEYAATATITGAASQTATITMTAGPNDASFTSNKLTAGDTVDTVTLTASYQGTKSTQSVSIVNPGLTLADASVEIGSTVTLTPTWSVITPSVTPTYTYSSSSQTVTVDSTTGVVSAALASIGDTATITVSATYGALQTALTATCTVTVTEVKELTVSGTHHLDVTDSTSSITLTAKYGGETVTPKWTTSSNLISVGETTGVVTPTSTGIASGGSATVTCTYGSKDPINFEIELASWKWIAVTETSSGSGVWEVYRLSTVSQSTITKLVLPSKYYGTDGTSSSVDVTQVKEAAFDSCSMESVVIPDSITDINQDAFAFNSGAETKSGYLTSVTINTTSNLKTLGKWAFYKQPIATNLTLPSKLESIGQWAFSSTFCTFTSITFAETTNWYCNGTLIDVSVPTTNATNFKTAGGDWGDYGLTRQS